MNSLDYVDNRPVKESLTLLDGKSYRIVKETTQSNSVKADTGTFTVKGVTDIFEYDLATYEDVQDIKLIPGNNNQIIIAISNMDGSTEIDIINTDNDSEVDVNGNVVSKVINTGKIEDSNGPILNIEIENIKVNSDGKLIVTTTDSSNQIEVNVDNLEAGNPIDVIKPELPEEKPEVVPPVEDTVTPPVGEDINNSNNGNISNNSDSETNNKEVNKLPNTGSPVGTEAVTMLGMLSAFIGTSLLKKKNKR